MARMHRKLAKHFQLSFRLAFKSEKLKVSESSSREFDKNEELGAFRQTCCFEPARRTRETVQTRIPSFDPKLSQVVTRG